MKRLIPILLACLCLTACQKATTAATKPVADDSIMSDRVNAFMKEYTAAHNKYYVSTAQPSDVSKSLFEVWYDEACVLVLVSRQDTCVKDVLGEPPIWDTTDFLDITDDTGFEWRKFSNYQERNDTLTICEHTVYIYVDFVERRDTVLHECTTITYSLSGGKFSKLSEVDTILGGYDWTAKCYFNEFKYNKKLHYLYDSIMEGNDVSDEQLLDAMPQNRDQFWVYTPEHYPYNDRSRIIDSMAISRAKDNPLLRDAYINMFHWSDGAASERLSEGYYPIFFYYDSVYFRDAIRRILPEYVDEFEADYIDEETNDIGWLRWVREHKDEILGSQP